MINVVTVDQMTICNVNRVAHGDEPRSFLDSGHSPELWDFSFFQGLSGYCFGYMFHNSTLSVNSLRSCGVVAIGSCLLKSSKNLLHTVQHQMLDKVTN